MPDPAPAPQTWLQQVRDVLLALAAVISAAGVPIGIIMANRNHGAVQQVDTKIDEKSQTIIEKQDTAKQETVEVKKITADTAKKNRAAIEVNLLGSATYLDDIAKDSGKPEDRAKADAAKKVLDEFRKNGS
jgi:hypothetical protein